MTTNEALLAKQEWDRLLDHYQLLLANHIQKEETIFIDCETTGLDKDNDEMLQLAIIDGLGHILFHEYLKPKYKQSWQETYAIHGISKEDVENCHTIDDYHQTIQDLINQARQVVIYNVPFDQGFLEAAGFCFEGKIMTCAMRMYAPIKGIWNEKYHNYRWHKLEAVCKHYGVLLDAHNALYDIEATRQIYYKMLEELENRK